MTVLRGLLVAAALALLFLAAAPSQAQKKVGGGDIKYPDNTKPPVTFSHAFHAEKGLKCTECHTKLFKMKKGESKFTMDDITAGKACGTCHNGTKAFSATDEAKCASCHKEPTTAPSAEPSAAPSAAPSTAPNTDNK